MVGTLFLMIEFIFKFNGQIETMHVATQQHILNPHPIHLPPIDHL